MEKTAFDARYQEYLVAIEDYLNSLFAEKPHWADLYEAMRYSVLSGGKRLRPVMTLEFARLCGLDWHKAVPVGCALELVHTYSLMMTCPAWMMTISAGVNPPTTRSMARPWQYWRETPSSLRPTA